MQKDLEVLNKLLYELQESEHVGQIIVIDNSCKGLKTDFSKVEVYVQKENLFVNPAWNLGIELMSDKYPIFGILNDDIILPKNLFKAVDEFFKNSDENVGLAGIDCAKNTPKELFDTYPKDSEVKFEKTNKLYGFWGAAFFGRKEHYYTIPNEMKIFYGDHFVFTRNLQNHRQNYKITNIEVKHLESLTSHCSKIARNYFAKDRKACIKHDGVEHQKLSILHRICSITYYHEHYVFCLLGIKVKFKCKKA